MYVKGIYYIGVGRLRDFCKSYLIFICEDVLEANFGAVLKTSNTVVTIYFLKWPAILNSNYTILETVWKAVFEAVWVAVLEFVFEPKYFLKNDVTHASSNL